MNQVQIKMLIAGVLVAAAVAFLAIASLRDGGFTYYLSVEEFLADQTKYAERVRLHGTVDAAGFSSNPGLLSASFTLVSGQTGIPVSYTGQIPDMFQANREVVIEGIYDQQNAIFNADVLMTKCASKYEAEGMPSDVADRDKSEETRAPSGTTSSAPGKNDQ